MSESPTNLDKQFGDRLRNDDQGFREEHWTHMEKLLDAQSGRPATFFSPKKKFITILALAVIGAISAFFLFDGTANKDAADAEINMEPATAQRSTQPENRREINIDKITRSPEKDENSSPITAYESNSSTISKETIAAYGSAAANGGRKKAGKSVKPGIVAGESIASDGDPFPVTDEGRTRLNSATVSEKGFSAYENSRVERIGIMARRFFIISPQPVIDMSRRTGLQKHILAMDTNASASSRLTNKKHQFKFVIGANSFKGVSDDNSTDKWGITPMLGFSYEYRISSHISLSAEADYLRRGGNSLNRSTTTITYFHHREYNIHSLKTKTMDFIFIPLTANYKLAQRHYIKAGASASVLLSTISDRKETYRNYYSEKASLQSDVKGYYTGLRRLSMGVTLGYEFRTDQRSYLGIRFSQSLTDLTNNAYYKINSKDLMSDLQLYIRLNAF